MFASSVATVGRPVPHVVVRPAFGDAGHHRQDRLFTIQGLDLAFLVDAENKRAVGRREVKADDIAHLVDEQRIVRQLERLAAVGLQAERRPHPADRGMRKAGLRRHRTDRPVRCVGRRGAQRWLDHGRNLIVVDGALPARTSLVEQAIAAILQEAAAPFANRVFVQAELGRDGLAGQAVRTSQNGAAPLGQPSAENAGNPRTSMSLRIENSVPRGTDPSFEESTRGSTMMRNIIAAITGAVISLGMAVQAGAQDRYDRRDDRRDDRRYDDRRYDDRRDERRRDEHRNRYDPRDTDQNGRLDRDERRYDPRDTNRDGTVDWRDKLEKLDPR